MQQARRTAGFPHARLGGALGLSLLAHAAIIVSLAWIPSDGAPAAASRKKGAMSLTVVPSRPGIDGMATKQSKAMASRKQPDPAVPTPSPPQAARPAATPMPATRQAMSEPADHGATTLPAPPASQAPGQQEPPRAETSTAIAEQLPAAPAATAYTGAETTAPPVARPGAQFASLFAPVIQRPIGRGRWRAPPSPPAPPDAQMQREQALEGLRQSLNVRLAQMQAALAQAPLQGRCEIRLDLDRRVADIQCTDTGETPRLWPMLDQLASAGLLTQASTLACMQAEGHEIHWRSCTLAQASSPSMGDRP
jgi:hypothetical protein